MAVGSDYCVFNMDCVTLLSCNLLHADAVAFMLRRRQVEFSQVLEE